MIVDHFLFPIPFVEQSYSRAKVSLSIIDYLLSVIDVLCFPLSTFFASSIGSYTLYLQFIKLQKEISQLIHIAVQQLET